MQIIRHQRQLKLREGHQNLISNLMISLEYGLKSRMACGMDGEDPARSLDLVVFEQVTCRQHRDFAMKLCPHSAYFYFQLISRFAFSNPDPCDLLRYL